MTYCGFLFIVKNTLPIYSPNKPMLNSCIPPKNTIAAIIDVHPAGIPGLIILLMIIINKYKNPVIEKNNPKTLEILKGLIEKFVNPSNHNCKSFLRV